MMTLKTNLTLEDLEDALDRAGLELFMTHNRWWGLRRNGRTRLWKTRPAEFAIPVKAGFRATLQLTEADLDRYNEGGPEAAGFRFL